MNSASQTSNDPLEPLKSQGQTSLSLGRDLEHEQRLDEIIACFLDDVARGQAPERGALVARHPDLAAELQAFFTDQDRFNRLATPLREIAPGIPKSGTNDLGSQGQTPALSDTHSFATRPSSGTGDTPLDAPLDSAATVADGAFDQGAPPPKWASLPTIAGYEMMEEIGRGGMGVVYKARQLSLKRLVAVKMMRGGAGARPQELARFEKEAHAVAHVRHPNVVQIHEVGHKDGYPYFCLELIEGGSLQKKLAGAPLPPRVAAKLVITLARAMHYAHECGIVHRDLKPANILLAGAPDAPVDQCVPKVTDFGLAKRLDDEIGGTRTGEIMGTPSYMSPEQASGRSKEVGPAADIYALGTILYELLTGRPPFKAPTALDTVLQVLHDDPLPPSRLLKGCPRDLETICLKCLEKEPPRRYASALALAEDLERFLESKTIHARPASVRERSVKWVWRNPGKAAVVAAVVAAGLLLAALLVGFNFHLQDRVRQAEADTEKAQKEEQESLRALRADASRQPVLAQLADARHALSPSDVKRKDLAGAATLAASAKDKTGSDPELDDLREKADRLLGEIQLLRAARANYDKLLAGRDEMIFGLNRKSITGEEAPENLVNIQRSATQALAAFEAAGDAAGGPKIDLCYSEQETQRITLACYELLLTLAEARLRFSDRQKGAKQALADLDRAAAFVPTTQIHHQRRARYLALTGDEPGARLERAKIEKLRPANALDQYLVGVELIEEGKVKEGRRHLELALQKQPDLFWARFFLAMDQLKRGPTADAKASLTVCIFQRPEFIWSYIVRGFIHGELGEFAAAEADFDAAWKLQPHKMADKSALYVLRVNQGVMLTKQHRLDDAIKEFTDAIDVQPQRFAAYLNLASAYQQQMKVDELGHHLLKLHTSQFHVWRNVEMSNHRQRLLDAAKRRLDQAIDLKPAATTLALLHRERGQVQRMRRELDLALGDFEQAVQLDRHGRMAHIDQLDCAAIHFQMGSYDAALAACRLALKLRPNFAAAYRLAGESYLEMRKFKEALYFLNLCLVFGTPQTEIVELRVFAHGKLRNAAAIPAEYDRALAIKPNDAALLTARGWAYLLNDAPKMALPDFQRVLALNPRHSHAYAGLGEALVKLGKPVEGAQHAAKAIELGPTESRTYYAAARVFALAGAALESASRPLDRAARDKSEELFREAVTCLSQGLELCDSEARRLDFWLSYIRPHSDRPGTTFYRMHASDRFRTMAARYQRMAQPAAGGDAPKQD